MYTYNKAGTNLKVCSNFKVGTNFKTYTTHKLGPDFKFQTLNFKAGTNSNSSA